VSLVDGSEHAQEHDHDERVRELPRARLLDHLGLRDLGEELLPVLDSVRDLGRQLCLLHRPAQADVTRRVHEEEADVVHDPEGQREPDAPERVAPLRRAHGEHRVLGLDQREPEPSHVTRLLCRQRDHRVTG
jgi:hypothetical protein